MLESILRDGFALAHRSLGLVLLDIVWKVVWLLVSVVALFLLAAWFGGELSTVSWEGTAVPAVNGVLIAALLRDFWATHRAAMLTAVLVVLFVSTVSWFTLEAFCRHRIVRALVAAHGTTSRGARDSRRGEREFNVFLLSGVIKSAFLAALGALLIPVFMAGAGILGVVIFLAPAFFLTIIDTLVRSDAVDLFGTDLIRVTGLIGILLLFESMIDAALVLIVVAGFLNVARLSEGLVMLGAAAAVIGLLNLLHGYLLLVRFSAVGIMRRNVVEV